MRAAAAVGPNARNPASLQPVNEPERQRVVRGDEHQVGLLALCEGNLPVKVGGFHRKALGDLCDAGVPWRYHEPADIALPMEYPGEGMLAAALADDEDVLLVAGLFRHGVSSEVRMD